MKAFQALRSTQILQRNTHVGLFSCIRLSSLIDCTNSTTAFNSICDSSNIVRKFAAAAPQAPKKATPTPPGGAAAKPDAKAKKDKKPRKARPHKPNVLPKWQGLRFKLPTKKGPKTIEQYSRPIPPPRYGMTLPLFLKLIGKNTAEVVGDKIKTWEELFTLRRRELKTLGIPVKQRRHILKWVELYRMGEEPRSFRMKSIAKKRKNEKKAARDKHLALLKQVNLQREKDGLPKCYIPKIKEPIKVKKAPPQKKKADKAPKKD